MPTVRQDEIDVDIIQHRPRIDPVLGLSNSPTNGAMWYDIVSNSFHGVVNGLVSPIGGSGSFGTSAIFATASKYGAKFDAKWVNDANITNTSKVVTSATANFSTTASVGQVVWAISDVNGLNGTVVLPIGTIT